MTLMKSGWIVIFAAIVCVASCPAAKAGVAKESSGEPPSQISIGGTVVDEAGAPVANVTVEVIETESWNPSEKKSKAQSDAAGNFTLDFSCTCYGAAVVARDDVRGRQGFAHCHLIDVRSNLREKVPPARIVLRKTREIPVRVTDGKGKPVANAKAGAIFESFSSTACLRFTDAEGKAVLRVPAEMALRCIFAVKERAGLDYFNYRTRQKGPGDFQKLPQDDKQPVQFVLDGARLLRVHVVDEGRQPLAGIHIRAAGVERPSKGGSAPLWGLEELQATTNAAGIAELRAIPVECRGGLVINSDTPDYRFNEQVKVDPDAQIDDVEIVTVRNPVLRVRVTYPDGRPALGAIVSSCWRRKDRWTMPFPIGVCNQDGKPRDYVQFGGRRFENSYCVVSAVGGRFASPIATRLARRRRAMEPVHLVLQPAARVHGALTVGKDHRPVPDARIELQQVDGGAALPDDEWPASSGRSRLLWIDHFARTDAQGRFEFFVLPGRYWLHSPNDCYNDFWVNKLIGTDLVRVLVQPEGANEFNLKGQTDVEINVHQAELDGRVVRASDGRGIPGVPLSCVSMDPRYSDAVSIGRAQWVLPRTNSDGRFHVVREPSEILLKAETPDHVLSGIVHVPADDANVTIPVGPTASVHGRLVDQLTGEPVLDAQVYCAIRVDFPDRSFRHEFSCFDRIDINDRGEFTLEHLVPGWKYEVYARVLGPAADKSPQQHLYDVTPTGPGRSELGDFPIRVDPSSAADSGRVK